MTGDRHSTPTGGPTGGPLTAARPAAPRLRAAVAGDLEALTALEAACFETDRLTRRSFRNFIEKGRATLLVADIDGRVAGYALVLYRSGTASARLYSIAVAPDARGRGVAESLMQSAEDAARARDCIVMRLEVRADNAAAIALYRRRGYRPFGRYLDYYEDHGEALRFQRPLIASSPTPTAPPYYAQTTEFTCGPAAMMMAMRALDPAAAFDRATEFRLWREATTVFMQAGHGGCEPVGMAVALARRGFAVEVFVNQDGPFFVDSVRAPDRREAIALIQADYAAQADDLGIPIHRAALGPAAMQEALDSGAVVLVLVSHYRMLRSRTPHWVLAYGRAGASILVHDPWVERDHMETEVAASALPIPLAAFDRMSRWGRSRLRAALVVRRGGPR